MASPVGHYEPIAREGYAFIIPPVLVAFGFWWFSYPWVSFLFLVISVGIALFFRNPERATLEDPSIVLAPADGRVAQIEPNVESRNIPGRSFKRISIFMSIFNVHVNRWPVSGQVREIAHVAGGFVDARDPAASLTNEHNSIVVETAEGPIEVVQIAGMIARRIACWVREGDQVRQGERLGLIRFGSRLDVYLPENFAFTVEIGTRVRAGTTVIAKKNDSSQGPIE
jgi:phosphatidylserine decarboxylase